MVMDKARSLFSLGLGKVASVIDGNPNYDQILGERLCKPEYSEVELESGKVSFLAAFQLVKQRISRDSIPVHEIVQSSDVFAYGATKNNKREFDFFLGLMERNGFENSLVNIHECEKAVVPFSGGYLEQKMLSSLNEFFLLRGEVSKGLLHQVINYTVSFLSAMETLRRVNAKLLVVANDHSPAPVAFTMAARLRGMTTLYVQHAEVTEIFPENDFDFSIFRNVASRAVYSRICGGRLKPNICLPRGGEQLYGEDILVSRMQLRVASESSVVIYPSSILNSDRLAALVKALKNNGAVKKVSIKPHPGYRSPELLAGIGADILDFFPSAPHVAICGNSSVVIELLSRGCLVCQYFGLDSIEPDYYGFVRGGLSNSLEESDALRMFWQREESQGFMSTLGAYLPELDTVENVLEKAREKLFFSNLLAASGCKGQPDKHALREYQLFRGLFCLKSSFLEGRGCGSRFDDFWTISVLNSYFDARAAALNDVYDSVYLESCATVLEFWLVAKKIEWTGFSPCREDLSFLLRFVSKFGGEHRALKWMETKIFDLLLRYGDSESLIQFFDMARVFDMQKTGVNRKVAFVRFVNGSADNSLRLKEFFDPEIENLTDLQKLKISVQAGSQLSASSGRQCFRKVEEHFLCALPAIRGEYYHFVLQAYARFGDRVKYIDVARCETQRRAFLDLVKDKLSKGKGFSFVRLSDGEGYLFSDYSTLFTREDALNRERHWWGGNIPESLREEVVNSGISAVKSADVLGIPSVYRFLRDQSDSSVSLQASLQGRGLLAVLEGVKALDNGEAIYADDKANIAVFRDIGNIRELCACANKVVIVSSGNEEILKSRIGGDYDFVIVNIPTHNKTATNVRYVRGDKPLPYVFQEICLRLKEVVDQGDLVLVGAGVAGKIFMDIAKQNSAVGLDLGSVMDELLEAGIHSLH